ncbi:MAG: hypothetical protein HPY55_02895 [Firmicutes bacterium]|nr:hypothetical protein [Bacillota bacterium]
MLKRIYILLFASSIVIPGYGGFLLACEEEETTVASGAESGARFSDVAQT